MPIPDYQTLMLPVLRRAAEGEIRVNEAVEKIAEEFRLTDGERAELLPSGKQTIIANRVHWAKTYLKQAGLVDATRRGYQSDLRAFRKWGGDVPTTPQEIARYIAEEGRRLHPSTLQRRLSALGSAHALAGGTDQPCHHPLVKAVFSGLRRQRGVAQPACNNLSCAWFATSLRSLFSNIRR